MRLSTLAAGVLFSFTMMGSAFADDAPKQMLTKEQVDQIVELGHKSANTFWKHYSEVRRIQRTTFGSATKEGAWEGAFAPAGAVMEAILSVPVGGPNGSFVFLPVAMFAGFIVGLPFALPGALVGAIKGPIEHGVDVCKLDSKIDGTKADACSLRRSLESVDLNSIDDATINALTQRVYNWGSNYKRRIEKDKNYKHIYPETYLPSFVDLKGTAIYDLVKAVLEKRFRDNVSPELFNSLCEKLELKTDAEKLHIFGSMYFLLKEINYSADANAVEDYLNFAFFKADQNVKKDL